MIGKEIGQNFELDGFWWIPNAESDRKPGKLTSRANEGIVLHLRGDLPRNSTRIEIILGKTYDEVECTLVNNYFVGPAIGSMNPDASHFFEATYLIIGKHFDTDSQIFTKTLSVNFTFLEEWLGFSPLSAGYPVNRISGKIESDLQISFIPPEHIKLSVPKIDSILQTDYTLDTDYGNYKPTSQSFLSYLTILPKKEQHYSWFLEQIRYIESLFYAIRWEA